LGNSGTGSPGTGSVSIIQPKPGLLGLWTPITVTTGFQEPSGILFDGSNIWVTDILANTLLKLGANGTVVQTVNVGSVPSFPAFDGTNIWVPNQVSNSVTVVRAATGAVVATLTGNGLNSPFQAAFDGQRILITNSLGNSVSLWKAADLTPISTFSTGTGTFPRGACSDGINFWIALNGTAQLARF
jgi:YVTN family beta-propeller protein